MTGPKVGIKIVSVEQLAKLAESKRSVYYPNWTKPLPAVVVLNMQAVLILRFIKKGLWEYKA